MPMPTLIQTDGGKGLPPYLLPGMGPCIEFFVLC